MKRERRNTDERLNILGLNGADLNLYLKMFTETREKQRFLIMAREGWREVKYPWSKDLILDHLSYRETIGLFPGHSIDYLMIDIDNHDSKTLQQLHRTANRVKDAFPGDPLSYQSSYSGGLRICYFLDNRIQRDLLLNWAESQLRSGGVSLGPGTVEIMANKKGDRLPFGDRSFLLDPLTLEPIYHLTLAEKIRFAGQIWQHQKMAVILPIPEGVKSPTGTCYRGDFVELVARLNDEGLFPGITTNDSFLKLGWDLIVRQGCPKKEAERYLQSWIRQKHNGLSNRFNKGRLDLLDKHITRVISSIKLGLVSYQGSKYSRRNKRLSLTDAKQIISLTADSRLQLATFSLLEYCLNFRKESTEKKELISNLYGAGQSPVTYGAEIRENDPRLRTPTNFYCPISKKTLRHLTGFDRSNPKSTLSRIIDLGLISLKRNAHPAAHKCREYWVLFPFNESDPARVVSLDEAKNLLRSQWQANCLSRVDDHTPK